MKIYKTIVLACAVILAGQCLRIIAHPLVPTDSPIQVAEAASYPQSLEMAMVDMQEADGLEVLLPDNGVEARQPLFQPMALPPFPTNKPERN